MKKIVAIVRVSTDAQDTISQEDSIKNYCKNNKIIIDEWVRDEGISGYKVSIEQRKSLQYIKELALNNELDTLIVFNTDRIARRTEGSMYLKLLASCGVKILSVTEGELFTNQDIDELLTFIRFYQAQTESKKISNRIKSAKKYGWENGNYEGGKVNYGYKLVNGRMEIDEIEGSIVKKIFETYISYGTTACLNWLHENNITKRGYKFTSSSIVMLLRNPIYYGQRQSKHNVPYDSTLAIVSYDTWTDAQKRLDERRTIGTTKHTNKSEALLESVLYHKAGNELHKCYVDYSYGKQKHLTYRCYTCRINKNRGKVKYNFSASKYHKLIENEIKQVLNTLDVNKLEDTYCKRRALELTRIQSEIDESTDVLNKKKLALTNGNNLLEKAFMGEIDADVSVISNKIKELQNNIVELEMKINNLDTELHKKELEQMNKIKLAEKYKDFNYLWDIADNIQKKAIIQELVDMIVIDGNDIEIKLNL